MPAVGPSPGAAYQDGCVTPEGYSRFRKFASPNFKNASIDKLDSCNEVSVGLLATMAITVAIWVIAIPIFDIAGLSWIRTWEGSMSMEKFRKSLESANLLHKSVATSFLVQNLDYGTIAGNSSLHFAFASTLTKRLAEGAGKHFEAEDVELTTSNGFIGNSTLADCRIAVPPHVSPEAAQSKLAAALPQIRNHVEMDLTANPDILTVASGPIIVYNESLVVIQDDVREAFAAFDLDKDNFSEFDEFVNGSLKLRPPLNREQAIHVFMGLDENADNTLEYLEFEDAMSHGHFFHYNASSFTTAIYSPTTTSTWTSSTTTSSTSATATSTRTVTTTATTTEGHTVHRSSRSEVDHHKGHAPNTSSTSSSTRTSTTTTPASSTTTTTPVPTVATVRMHVFALNGAKLTSEQKAGIARAYRKDLAYAAGILSSQVMDLNGRRGCVSLSSTPLAAAGRAGVKATEDHVVAQGCLPIPEGATVEDIEAVVTSGTETQKIVKDFVAVDGGRAFSSHDVDVSVAAQTSCHTLADDHRSAEAFCEGAAIPTTMEAQPTTAPRQTTSGRAAAPANILSMAEFLHRMGAAESDAPRDAFAALDGNGDDLADLAEFEKATAKFHPALSKSQSDNMFDWLDTNHDGRIESMEFFEAFKAASTSRPPPGTDARGPLTLAQYRQSLGHHPRYSKVGVGLCRTSEEAWPGSAEHPEDTTKASCQGLCTASPTCGAFAFKLGGTCRIYPSGAEYPDTTPMTDVECFAKTFSDEAHFDLVRACFRFLGNAGLGSLTKAQTTAASAQLAESMAFEVGTQLHSIKSPLGTPGTCSTFFNGGTGGSAEHVPPGEQKGASDTLEAICLIDVPKGQRIEDLTAVLVAEPTKARLASDLSALLSIPHIESSAIDVSIHGTSAKFRTLDADDTGTLSLAEFMQAAKVFTPPLDQDAAEYAFRGLDVDKDDQLSANEFEANGLKDFFQPPPND